jgi:hypothetical protein
MSVTPMFLSPLRVEQLDKDNWKLLDTLRFYSVELGRMILVPTGFVTDFASVPRLPFIYWATGGTAEAPAVLHDWLYRTGAESVTRKQADAVFSEAIISREYYWKLRAWSMWAGVRIGGYWSYQTRARNEQLQLQPQS